MFSQKSKSLSAQQLAEAREVFALLDVSHDDVLDRGDLQQLYDAFQQRSTMHTLQELIEEVDADGNGTIDVVEFVNLIAGHVGRPLEDQCTDAIQLLSAQGGAITLQQLFTAMRALNLDITEDELRLLYETNTGTPGTRSVLVDAQALAALARERK